MVTTPACDPARAAAGIKTIEEATTTDMILLMVLLLAIDNRVYFRTGEVAAEDTTKYR
jgi:hypothetical protein